MAADPASDNPDGEPIQDGVFFTLPDALPRGRHKLSRDQVREAQHERSLAAMTELLAARGYRGFSVDDIAGRAGISVNALYECFDSKDACVFAGYDRFVEVLLRSMAELTGEMNDQSTLVHLGRAEPEPAPVWPRYPVVKSRYIDQDLVCSLREFEDGSAQEPLQFNLPDAGTNQLRPGPLVFASTGFGADAVTSRAAESPGLSLLSAPTGTDARRGQARDAREAGLCHSHWSGLFSAENGSDGLAHGEP